MIQRLRAFLATGEGKALAAILLLALALRVAGAAGTRVISHDGARFTVMARAIQDGDWQAALHVEPLMPPLYPWLIARLGALVGDLRLAGVLISILAGTLAILPLWMLARAAFPPNAALLAALVLAIWPDWALLGGDVWTEPLFLSLLFGSFAATWHAADEPAGWKFALAGLLAGLALNVRPEGIYAAAALLGWPAIAAWIHRRDPEGRATRLAGPLLGLALVAILILPYATWIHSSFGFWSFTPNQFAAKLLGGKIVEHSFTEGYRLDESTFEAGQDQQRWGRTAGLLVLAAKTYWRVSGYVFLPLVAGGLLLLRRHRPRGSPFAFLVLLSLGYAGPVWLGLFKGLPFGERYILPSLLVLAPLAALPLFALLERRTLFRAAVALLVLGCAIRIATPHDAKRLSLAEAGTWIRQKYGPRKWIVTMDRRVEHYADAYSQRVAGSWDETRRRALDTGAVALVLYDPYVDRLEAGFAEQLAKAGWPLVHTVEAGRHTVRIHEVKRGP